MNEILLPTRLESKSRQNQPHLTNILHKNVSSPGKFEKKNPHICLHDLIIR